MSAEQLFLPSRAQAGPSYMAVEGAFFIVIKNDNQFDAATFSLGTGQPWTAPSSYASL